MNVSFSFDPSSNTICISGTSRDDLYEYISGMTGSEIKTHLALLTHASVRTEDTGRCTPGKKTLARETGLTLPTIQAALLGLVGKNLITQTVRKGTSTLYEMLQFVRKIEGGVKNFYPNNVVVDKKSLQVKKIDPNNNKQLGERNFTPPAPESPLPEEWQPVYEELVQEDMTPHVARQIMEAVIKAHKPVQDVKVWLAAYRDGKKENGGSIESVGWLVKMLRDWTSGKVKGIPDKYADLALTDEQREEQERKARWAYQQDLIDIGYAQA